MDNLQRLTKGLECLGLDLCAANSYYRYLELLSKWNKHFNLTSINSISKMISHHILDSLAVLPHVQGPRIIDVGSGAGLPGIPLAIAKPEWQFSLLDSNGKKTRFMTQAKHELGLENCEIIQQRAEDFCPQSQFDSVLTRAFADINGMLAVTQHLCAASGVILGMRGKVADQELAELPAGIRLIGVEKLQVPQLDAERHVVCLQSAIVKG